MKKHTVMIIVACMSTMISAEGWASSLHCANPNNWQANNLNPSITSINGLGPVFTMKNTYNLYAMAIGPDMSGPPLNLMCYDNQGETSTFSLQTDELNTMLAKSIINTFPDNNVSGYELSSHSNPLTAAADYVAAHSKNPSGLCTQEEGWFLWQGSYVCPGDLNSSCTASSSQACAGAYSMNIPSGNPGRMPGPGF